MIHPNGRRYEEMTKAVFSFVHALAPSAYRFLKQNHENLPDEKTLQRFMTAKFESYVKSGILVSENPQDAKLSIVNGRILL